MRIAWRSILRVVDLAQSRTGFKQTAPSYLQALILLLYTFNPYQIKTHPSFLCTGRPLARNITSSYLDETYMPSGRGRPNPRQISNELFKDPSALSRPSIQNKTAFFAFFGKISFQTAASDLVSMRLDAFRVERTNEQVTKRINTHHMLKRRRTRVFPGSCIWQPFVQRLEVMRGHTVWTLHWQT